MEPDDESSLDMGKHVLSGGGDESYVRLLVLLHNTLVAVRAGLVSDTGTVPDRFYIPPPQRFPDTTLEMEPAIARLITPYNTRGEIAAADDAGNGLDLSLTDGTDSVGTIGVPQKDARPTRRRRLFKTPQQPRPRISSRKTLLTLYYSLYIDFFSSMYKRLVLTETRIVALMRELYVQILRDVNTWHRSEEEDTGIPRAFVGAGAYNTPVGKIERSELNGADPSTVAREQLTKWREHWRKHVNIKPIDERIDFRFRVVSYLENMMRQIAIRLSTDASDAASDAARLNLTGLSNTTEETIYRALDGELRPTRAQQDFKENRFFWFRGFYLSLLALDDFAGLTRVKNQIADYVQAQIYVPKLDANDYSNFAFFGNPGTGKTELALKLADILFYNGTSLRRSDGSLSLTTRNDFVAPFEGQTAPMTNNLFLNAAVGSVMVVDEAYSLVTSERDSSGIEALAEYVKLMSQFKGLSASVITGYEENIRAQLFETNPGMARRFPFVFTFENYTADELFTIAQRLLEGVFRGIITVPSSAQARLLELLKENVSYRRSEETRAFDVFYNTNAGGVRNLMTSLVRHVVTKSTGRAAILTYGRLGRSEREDAMDVVDADRLRTAPARGRSAFAVTEVDVTVVFHKFVADQLPSSAREQYVALRS